jgi:glyoxylase-like metal-dependent hydrolase (beta-lactamase superfamily II)
MLFRQLFDWESSTYTYLIADLATAEALLVDPVLAQVERDRQLLHELGLTLRYCLESHVHADHITGAAQLRSATGCLSVVLDRAQVDCADRLSSICMAALLLGRIWVTRSHRVKTHRLVYFDKSRLWRVAWCYSAQC